MPVHMTASIWQSKWWQRQQADSPPFLCIEYYLRGLFLCRRVKSELARHSLPQEISKKSCDLVVSTIAKDMLASSMPFSSRRTASKRTSKSAVTRPVKDLETIEFSVKKEILVRTTAAAGCWWMKELLLVNIRAAPREGKSHN